MHCNPKGHNASKLQRYKKKSSYKEKRTIILSGNNPWDNNKKGLCLSTAAIMRKNVFSIFS